MDVEISVDGKRLPLNAFTQEFIGNVSVAMAESLRGVEPGWKEVVIRIAQ
jgi:hypothetical protein